MAQIREIYYSSIGRGLLPEEKKVCRKETIGSGELLYLDQHIIKDNKTRRKNVAMARMGNKKAYNIVPQGWIIETASNCIRYPTKS